MKKPLLAVAALLPATLIAVLYVWLETNESQPSGATPHEREERAAAPVAGEPDAARADRAPSAVAETPRANDERGATALQENSRTDVDKSKRIRVSGSVRVPPETPRDEQLEVLVFRDGSDPARAASDKRNELLANEERLFARAPVAADGSFEVEAPGDGATTWLAVRGRYLFVDEAKKLDATASANAIELTPKLGAWVTGRITLPAGASLDQLDSDKTELELKFDEMKVVNLMSSVSRITELRQRETTCSPDGTFEFRGVGSEIDYDLRVVPEHFAAHKSDKFAVAPGKHVELAVQLVRGGTVVGRVQDLEGHALEGAEIEATIDPLVWGRGGFEVRKAKTEADGRFELAAVVPGKLDLDVKREGYLDRQLHVEVRDGERSEVGEVALGRGESIAGRVTWPDGSPVADIDVDVDFDPAALGGMSAFNAFQGAEGEDETDAEGRFEVSGLGKGPFVVTAAAPAKDATVPAGDGEHAHSEAKPKRDGTLWRAKLAGVKPGTRGVELVLSAPMAVTGRVVDRTGAPIAAFRVSAREQTGGMLSGLGGAHESKRFTDAEGRFELGGLAPGRWSVDAEADDFTRCAAVEVTLPLAPDAVPLEFVLQRGGVVSGVVLSPNGAPMAGAEIALKLNFQDMMKLRGEDGERPPLAKSDADGKFVLRNLAAGKLSVVARMDGMAESEPASIELTPEQEVSGVTLQLREGGTITGEVYGKEGAPLPGVQILAQISTDPISQRFATADSQGRFEFAHMVPATYNVMHLPYDRMRDAPEGGDTADFTAVFSDMKMASATVTEGQETHVMLGAPPKNPVELRGRVTTGERPVPSAIVTFMADGKKGLDGLKFVTTNSEGVYSTRLNEPGRYLISVQKAGLSGEQQTVSHVLDVPEVEEFEHDIRMPMGSITGTVLDPDGHAAGGVRVSLAVDGAIPNGSLFGEHYAEISTDDAGHFELIWLKPGTYSVAVGGSPWGGLFGGGGATSGRQVHSGIEVKEGARVEGVDFRLKKPGRVEGVARSSEGKPVPEAAIFLRDSAGRTLERFSFIATDASGRFSYDGLEPGEYSVCARTTSEISAEEVNVRIREDATTEVELTLSAGTVLLVSLTNDDGQAIDCSLKVIDEAGHQVNGTMSLSEVMKLMSSGSFTTKEQRIGPLPPGKYRVFASTSDGRSANKPVTLTGQAERKLNIRL